MAEAQQDTTSSFLIKIDKIRKKSYANSIFLKPDDVIVALNNQFYTFGEKKFVEELKDVKKSNERALLTVLRNEIFIDIIIENSLGCGFITTDSNETEKIKEKFSKKNNYDIEELKDYVAMRDVYRRYDVYETIILYLLVFFLHFLHMHANGGFYYHFQYCFLCYFP